MPARVPRRSGGEVLAGIALTATGRKGGLHRFGSSRERFLASLAPLIAFPLVGAVLVGASGRPGEAGIQFLATLCAILAPLVVSYEFTRWWRRTDLWLRYATAFNWCQWAIPVLAVFALVILTPALRGLLGPDGALEAAIGVTGAYAPWLHWFIARHALTISVMRAILLVIAVNIASVAVALGPMLLLHRGL